MSYGSMNAAAVESVKHRVGALPKWPVKGLETAPPQACPEPANGWSDGEDCSVHLGLARCLSGPSPLFEPEGVSSPSAANPGPRGVGRKLSADLETRFRLTGGA